MTRAGGEGEECRKLRLVGVSEFATAMPLPPCRDAVVVVSFVVLWAAAVLFAWSFAIYFRCRQARAGSAWANPRAGKHGQAASLYPQGGMEALFRASGQAGLRRKGAALFNLLPPLRLA